MKQGIHLGTPVRPGARLVRYAFWSLLLLTFVHGFSYLRDFRALSGMREELEARRESLPRDAVADPDAPSLSIAHLEAAQDLGVTRRPSASVLLDEIATRIPPSVTLTSLGISFGGGASTARLVLEGVARNSSAVSALQERLDASSFVARTEVLEERRIAAGGIAVRLQLDLSSRRGSAP